MIQKNLLPKINVSKKYPSSRFLSVPQKRTSRDCSRFSGCEGLFILGMMVLSPLAHAEIDINVISTIESSNNPNVYNQKSNAYGLYQITPIALKDYNNLHPGREIQFPSPTYTQEKVAAWMFTKRIPQLLKHYGKTITIKNVLTAYNCGYKKYCYENPPKETMDYVEKYKRLAHANSR